MAGWVWTIKCVTRRIWYDRFVPPSFVGRLMHTSTYGPPSHRGSPFTQSSPPLSSGISPSPFSPIHRFTNLSVLGTIDDHGRSTNSPGSLFSDGAAVRPSDVSPFVDFTGVSDVIDDESDVSDDSLSLESDKERDDNFLSQGSAHQLVSEHTKWQRQVDTKPSEDHRRSSRHFNGLKTYTSILPVPSSSPVQNPMGQGRVEVISVRPTAKRKKSGSDDSIATISSNAADAQDLSTSSVPYKECLRIKLPRAAKKICFRRLGDTEEKAEEEEEEEFIYASSSRPALRPAMRTLQKRLWAKA